MASRARGDRKRTGDGAGHGFHTVVNGVDADETGLFFEKSGHQRGFVDLRRGRIGSHLVAEHVFDMVFFKSGNDIIPGPGGFIGAAPGHGGQAADAAFFECRRDFFDFADRAAAERDEGVQAEFLDFVNVQTVVEHNILLELFHSIDIR